MKKDFEEKFPFISFSHREIFEDEGNIFVMQTFHCIVLGLQTYLIYIINNGMCDKFGHYIKHVNLLRSPIPHKQMSVFQL